MYIRSIYRPVALLLGVIAACMCLSSCIYDDLSGCGVKVEFRYTHNMLGVDAFHKEADWVNLWVFDSLGHLVDEHYTNIINSDRSFTFTIPALPEGEYSFVAWAGGNSSKGEYADFIFENLNAKDRIEKLTARLPRNEDGSHNYPINSMLNGTLTAQITGGPQTIQISMLKYTHDIRVILMPLQNEKEIRATDFDFSIEDMNGTLRYDGLPAHRDSVVYKHYFKTVTSDPDTPSTRASSVTSALIADMNTSRLFYETSPRLIVHDNETGNEVININLTWYLSLQVIGEHLTEWSNQEYLDRQDTYSLTFFIDMDNRTWSQTQIIVNGWVVSLEDVTL